MSFLPYLYLLGGIALLWISAEALVRGSTAMGRRAGVSPMIIGLTVVSIATSLPELAVSLLAALQDSPDLAVGNVLGSNLANIGLILGCAALLSPITLHSQVVRREIPWMLAITVVALPLFWNLEMGRVEGTIFASILFAYIYFLVRTAGVEKAISEITLEEEPPSYARSSLLVLGGMAGLVASGRGIVDGATAIAGQFGVPEMIVGLSVVAVGTSLPELATTVVAAFRREADLAVGNVVGSNIFNLTFVLGGTALVHPIRIDPSTLRVEYPAVLVMSILIIPLALPKMTLGRPQGFMFLALYAAAWAWILLARGGW